MNRFREPDHIEVGAVLRVLSLLLLFAASAWLLLSDYHPMSLAVLTSVYFCAYVAFRLIWFLDNNSFTPQRRQVGLTWALTGFNADTSEFDGRPVRVYFLLLTLMSAGLFLRPIVRAVVL
ncbi:hypothetical protein [Oceanibium sediminis]|uniref:hypothetical protein n=1 Tax=Oceanibium sediminis TaxID=2026339 RepID=UPI000DD3A2D5|nr:hypothetical protein [Oceanibium sediminis]